MSRYSAEFDDAETDPEVMGIYVDANSLAEAEEKVSTIKQALRLTDDDCFVLLATDDPALKNDVRSLLPHTFSIVCKGGTYRVSRPNYLREGERAYVVDVEGVEAYARECDERVALAERRRDESEYLLQAHELQDERRGEILLRKLDQIERNVIGDEESSDRASKKSNFLEAALRNYAEHAWHDIKRSLVEKGWS